jgi:predicted O-methyltransferase YrrM
LPTPRFLKNASQWLFELGQIFGLFIIPNHYYVPVTSTRTLRATRSRWNNPVDVSNLPMSLESQREFLLQRIAPFQHEYAGNQVYNQALAQSVGPGYGFIEAEALHGFVRAMKPSRIIEVGSGVSTFCMLHATRMNEAEGAPPCAITCVEPYPRAALRAQPVSLVEEKVEEVDLNQFDQLNAGDLLFIDSSHAIRPCGDVGRIYVEIFPRLKPGVLIHIHDIFIPYAFQRSVEESYLQWMETALLIAMLNHTTRYEVVLCQSYLHYTSPDVLRTAFPDYRPAGNNGGLVDPSADMSSGFHFPSATFLRVR